MTSLSIKPDLNGSQQTFLDCFRIFAALLVLLGHAFLYAGLTIFQTEAYFPSLADTGVVLLFLLSGFLTAYTLERKNVSHDYSYTRYVRHKIIRIMWEYIPALLFIAVIDAVSIRHNPSMYRYYESYDWKSFLGNLLLLQWTSINHIPGIHLLAFGSGKPLWTLSIEWFFYLIYAKLYLSISNRLEFGWKDIAVLGASLLLTIEFLIGGRGGGLGVVFSLGVLAYYFYDRISQRIALPLFLGSLMLFILYGIIKKQVYSIFPFLFLWMFLCSGVKLFQQKTSSARNPILSFLSGSTFMLYMIHWSIFDFFYCFQLSIDPKLFFILITAPSIGIALILYACFGRRKLLKRLAAKRRKL